MATKLVQDTVRLQTSLQWHAGVMGLNHILLGKHLNWKALLNTKCCCLIRNQLLCTVKQPAKNELATENHQLCDGYGFLSEDGIVGVMWVLLNL
jgi:hypothetical protein